MQNTLRTPLTVSVTITASLGEVWEAYTNPTVVQKWNAASPDWHCPKAENDLRPGGRFCYRMEARDGSEAFDFTGSYDEVVLYERIVYTMDDGRRAEVMFSGDGSSTAVTTMFEPESENALELQEQGWQAILDNFKRVVEESR